MKQIAIFGASGFGCEVLSCLMDIRGRHDHSEGTLFVEKDEFAAENKMVLGVRVISEEEFDPNTYKAVVAIGDPKLREKIVTALPEKTEFATLIHPSAVVSPWVEIGEGSIITAGCVLTTNIAIGIHAHLNLNTTIGHDCVIGSFFTTAPGCNISGQCQIGDRVYLGSNSAIKQSINISSDSVVGMGAVVVKDITDPGVYIGNPAHRLEH